MTIKFGDDNVKSSTLKQSKRLMPSSLRRAEMPTHNLLRSAK
ncbi:hypothetical protein [Schleiferilactobacillus harbinensis]|nr:hypothetical protein [Schleiferilactobacillus harbinensis]